MSNASGTAKKSGGFARDENPVVFIEVSTTGINSSTNRKYCEPRVIGKLYFELRQDIAPVSSSNFLQLLLGDVGKVRKTEPGYEDIYRYKGTRIHRIVKNMLMEGGDLKGLDGECSKSAFPPTPSNPDGLFADENFILRHTGPGVLSFCNRGPDTNGSLFQVTFARNDHMDEKYVVFGCLVNADSFRTLEEVNMLGSPHGQPLAEVFISDTGKVFPAGD
jgi:peptidyl-prolyl isomerase G (cyclophilin G)